MKDFPDHQVAVAGVLGTMPLDDVLMYAKKANRIGPFQAIRADRVAGVDHVVSAAMHAQRAFAEGRNHAKTLDVEFLRYAAGERQIKKAIAKLGLPDPVEACLFVAMGEKRLDVLPYALHTAGAKEDEALLQFDATQVARDFGIDADVLAATDAALHADLVLEAVASVDLQS